MGARATLTRLLAVAILVAAACGAHAHSYKQKSLEIVHPWCLETDTKSAAVYMVIRALSKRGDRLTGVRTSIGKAELREPATTEDSRSVAALEVKSKKDLTLKRGGPHILVTGLTKPLAAYDSFLLTLTFARAGQIEVEVMVEEKSTSEPPKH